jgi:hypothetical protein
LQFEEHAEDSAIQVANRFFARLVQTADIAVSKLFPGGFMWQAGSVVAVNAGFQSTDVAFALATGVGDCIGVSVGHVLFTAIKSIFTGQSVAKEIPVGVWLGSAAFWSGTLWQPAVNLCAGFGWSFPAVFLGVGAICCAAFFVGLRGGRVLYRGIGITGNNSHNFGEDVGLSVAIGGAAGMFCATDITIPKNAWDVYFGVTPSMTPVEGCMRAGASTALGFSIAQILQNTRAPDSGAYITRNTWAKVSSAIGEGIVTSAPSAQGAVKNFIDNGAAKLFDKIDANGDGRLTPQEVIDHINARKDM